MLALVRRVVPLPPVERLLPAEPEMTPEIVRGLELKLFQVCEAPRRDVRGNRHGAGIG